MPRIDHTLPQIAVLKEEALKHRATSRALLTDALAEHPELLEMFVKYDSSEREMEILCRMELEIIANGKTAQASQSVFGRLSGRDLSPGVGSLPEPRDPPAKPIVTPSSADSPLPSAGDGF